MEHGNITPPDLIDFSVEPRASCTPGPRLVGSSVGWRCHAEGLARIWIQTCNRALVCNVLPDDAGATSAAATAQARQCAASAPDLMSFGSPAASDPAMRDLPRDPLPDVLHPTKW